jgi:hypothetical protein
MTPSVPPGPLDDPTVSDPLECPPLKWGLIGCGRVSHDFTQALKHLPSQSVVACSARSEESAKEFAEKHNIQSYCKFLLCTEFLLKVAMTQLVLHNLIVRRRIRSLGR